MFVYLANESSSSLSLGSLISKPSSNITNSFYNEAWFKYI